jgi:hypothetical protein
MVFLVCIVKKVEDIPGGIRSSSSAVFFLFLSLSREIDRSESDQSEAMIIISDLHVLNTLLVIS